MPIYEYYCPQNHTIYQFYAKTLAQGKTVPKCPDNPRFRMEKVLSAFAVTSGRSEAPPASTTDKPAMGTEDPREASAMAAMEKEFSNFDDEDPKAMGRMMRRMAELSGEKMEGKIEEVVRKLEEGTDPEALEEQFGDDAPEANAEAETPETTGNDRKQGQRRFRSRTAAPARDPKLYDYE